ncbi:sodium channel modifier 1 isoform X2 [Passer montanus]|uniref:sodium channel modifier 1 isoform X2 n=1 Tax=Passer montanus TaxID=9160 RepID=UPI00195FA48D|nr:sodium channel modifier 1 isoform X2 [Passer montanus]
MSFKRDESDPGPLGALQRRRVAELLASAIPEDEALLLRDGRRCCCTARAGSTWTACSVPSGAAGPTRPRRDPRSPRGRSQGGRTKGSSCRAGIPGVIPKNPQTPPKSSGNPGNPGNPETPGPTHREGAPKDRKRRKGNSRSSEGPEGPSPERLRILRHHLHLRSRGWIQDPSGNWVKDGNAEFDSDEEEPPPLPPA